MEPRECLRCGDEIEKYVKGAFYLCADCWLVTGSRPNIHSKVCDMCGDTWHENTIPMCQQCYEYDGVKDKDAN